MEISDALPPRTTAFLWIIQEFSSWPISKGNRMESRLFSLNGCILKHWCVTLSLPYGERNADKPWLDATLHMKTSDPNMNFNTCIKFAIIDQNLCQKNPKTKLHTFTCQQNSCCFLDYIRPDKLLNPFENYLFSGNLMLYCHIIILDDNHSDSPPHYDIAKCYESLLKKELCSDVIVQVKNKQFKCHKFLLACRSAYLSNIFTRIVSNPNEVIFTDIEPEIFQKLLCYIYTGHVDVSYEEAFQLFLEADMFQLPRLKLVCENILYSCLRLENAAEYLAFAVRYHLRNLRNKAHLISTIFVKMPTPGFFKQKPVSSVGNSISEDNPITQASATSVRRKTKYRKFADTTTVPPEIDFWCFTERIILAKETLKIEKFKERCSRSGTLSYCVISTNEATWQIDVCIEKNLDDIFILNLYLKLISCKESTTTFFAEYKFSIINLWYNETNIITDNCDFTVNDCLTVHFAGADEILHNEDSLHDCDLLLHCCFSSTESHLFDCRRPDVPKCDLAENLSSLQNNQQFTDIIINVQGELFPSHKAILACHSRFFASMFQNNGCSEGKIDVHDIKPNIFKKVLSTMYSGRCDLDLSEMLELAVIDDKYCLFGKASIFLRAFISALRVENAAKTLTCIDLYKAKKLKKYTVNFIAENFEKVIDTSEWSYVAKNEKLFTACVNAYIS